MKLHATYSSEKHLMCLVEILPDMKQKVWIQYIISRSMGIYNNASKVELVCLPRNAFEYETGHFLKLYQLPFLKKPYPII